MRIYVQAEHPLPEILATRGRNFVLDFFFFFQTLDYLHRAQERASLLTQGWHRAHLCFVDTGGVIAYDILYNFVNETKSSWCGMFHLWHHAGAQEVSDLGIL